MMLFTLSVSVSSAQAQNQCRALGVPEAQIQGLSNQAIQSQLINYAKQNVKDFCHRNMVLRYLVANKVAVNSCSSDSLSDLERLVLLKRNAKHDVSAWHLSITPTEATKRAAVGQIVPSNIASTFFKSSQADAVPVEVRNASYARLRARLSEEVHTGLIAEASNDIKIRGFCSFENLVSSDVCVKAMKLSKDKFLPRGGNDVVDVDLWKRVIGSGFCDKGILAAADLIANRRPLQEGDAMSDILLAFKQSGYSDAQATQGAWDTLAIMSNHGPNIKTYIMRFADKRDYVVLYQKALALSYISASMALNDYLNLQANLPMYSYPKNVKTACDNSKPYHFWLIAYMARELRIRHGLTSYQASAIAFMAETGIGGFLDGVFGGSPTLLSSYLRWQKTFQADSAFHALEKK